MNKLIQELMIQAKAEVRSEEEIEGIACDDFDAQVMEKFAELIVQEVKTLIEDAYLNTDPEHRKCLLVLDEKVDKHFGVEE
jgi:hypothetical protein